MKRLSVAFRVEATPSPQPAVAFVGPRHARLLHAFRPRAQRYKRRKLIAISLGVGFLVACGALAQTPLGNLLGIRGAILLLALWLGAVLIPLFGLRLICPACRKRLEPAKGRYCPQCGSDKYDKGRHMRGPALARYAFCPSCDTTIDDGVDPRSYRIRGCTHCGVMLDEHGV